MPPRWSLFVDESGRFEPGDPSLVAGLVAEAPADALGGGRLRAELEDIWGPGPWPPHASHLRFPAARVLYAARAHARDMPAGRLAKGLDAREFTQRLAASPFGPRLAAIRDGAFPTWEDCRDADAVLRAHPRHGALLAVQEAQDLAMNDLVGRVLARVRGAVVVALADDAPPGPPPAPREVREDAYVRALGVALERLARLAGGADVECFVLAREVEVGGLGKADMQGFFLKGIVDRAAGAAGGAARLRPGGTVLRYRDDPRAPMHPALVLADWLANRMRHAIAAHRGGLDPLVDRLVANGVLPSADPVLRAPARAPAVGPLPTLAAAGPPEDAVRAAFAGGSPALDASPAWVWDQARRWVTAAGSWR
ncbi:MAG: hypothetical protein ACOZNI_08645 [Myxococcota bacterium]